MSPSGADTFTDVAVQPDGKIVATSSVYTSYPSSYEYGVVRYHPDGTLDTSFDADGQVTLPGGPPTVVALQEDGKILVGGYLSLIGGLALEVIRLNPDGSLDTTFADAGRFQTEVVGGEVVGLAVQQDGRILIAGSGDNAFRLIRLDARGSYDLTFGEGGTALTTFEEGGSFLAADAQSMTLMDDGRILVNGYVNWPTARVALARFNSDGTLDQTFGTEGRLLATFGTRELYTGHNEAAVQPDGKIVLQGRTSLGELVLMRLNENGSPDTTFSGDALVFVSGNGLYSGDLMIQPNGKILIGGTHGDGFGLWRFNTNGSVDSSFGVGGHVQTFMGDRGLNDAIGALALLPDGGLVAAGVADYENGSPSRSKAGIARYRPNGSLDPLFGNSAYPLDVFEPNDTMATAADLGTGDQYVAGLTLHDTFYDDYRDSSRVIYQKRMPDVDHYRWAAAESGTLAIDLLYLEELGDIHLELYTPGGVRVGGSDFTYQRIVRTVSAGEEYIIRVANPGGLNPTYSLVVDGPGVREPVVSGSTVDVYGMASDDDFTLRAGSTHRVTVNGAVFNYSASAVSTFRFHGEAGSDSLTVTGTGGDETVNLQVGSLLVTGPGYRATGSDIETVKIIGGGGTDEATLIDSPGNDRLTARPAFTRLTGAGYFHQVDGFDQVVVKATSGGTDDRADFFDSPGNDRLFMKPTYTEMTGSEFLNRAIGFDRVYATVVEGGGNDRAWLYDSAEDDTLSVWPDRAVFSGPGFQNTARGFDRVIAYATRGGENDRAFLYDSPGDDRLAMKSGYSRMSGAGFYNHVQRFDRVNAYSTAGGNGRVDFYDSRADDESTARPESSTMTGPGFVNSASGFSRTYAYAIYGGSDRAMLYDSSGDDRLAMKAGFSRMSGAGFYSHAQRFERVEAYSTAGDDRADFYDSAGDDEFIGRPDSSKLRGAGFFNVATGFGRVFAHAVLGGDDRARLYDSAGDDRFTSRATYARIEGTGFYIDTRQFETVVATGGTGDDRALLLDFNTGEQVSGSGDAFRADRQFVRERLFGFDAVEVRAAAGQTPSSTVDSLAVDYAFEQLGTWI